MRLTITANPINQYHRWQGLSLPQGMTRKYIKDSFPLLPVRASLPDLDIETEPAIDRPKTPSKARACLSRQRNEAT